ncbi:hypothetical protein LJC55_04285 [Eubacteriales bacterium OttesenSCG-928-N14]|nr:hypothetical protein [Eubacteriales bacterium OttesenSCG-928-N14]
MESGEDANEKLQQDFITASILVDVPVSGVYYRLIVYNTPEIRRVVLVYENEAVFTTKSYTDPIGHRGKGILRMDMDELMEMDPYLNMKPDTAGYIYRAQSERDDGEGFRFVVAMSREFVTSYSASYQFANAEELYPILCYALSENKDGTAEYQLFVDDLLRQNPLPMSDVKEALNGDFATLRIMKKLPNGKYGEDYTIINRNADGYELMCMLMISELVNGE